MNEWRRSGTYIQWNYYPAIKRNAFDSALMKWMNLEPIIEWSKSERERQILYINTSMWNLERWYWWTYLQGGLRDRDTRTDLWTWGEGTGEQTESSIKTETLPYVKLDSQWKFAVWLRELKSGALWQSRGVGWGGRWEGRSRRRGHTYRTYTYLWLIHVDMWQKPSQYCKAIVLQLNINKFKRYIYIYLYFYVL